MPIFDKIKDVLSSNKTNNANLTVTTSSNNFSNNEHPIVQNTNINNNNNDINKATEVDKTNILNEDIANQEVKSLKSDLSFLSLSKEKKSAAHANRLMINGYQAIKLKILLEKMKIQFEKSYLDNSKSPISDDVVKFYDQIKTLGSGSFGKVILIRSKKSEKYHAMKVMSKKEIFKDGHVPHVIEEKRILASISNQFIITMIAHHQDNSYVYLILDYINGGEMFTHLRSKRRFPENLSRFYASQVVLAFEYMHYMDIIYRDLKPENILIGRNGYLKIIDLGFAKKANGIVWTLCGTPEYIAPEILLNKGYNKSIDWYAFGILLYEMTCGFTPYWADQHIKIYEKILEAKLKFPTGFSSELKDLIRNLLQKDLTYRFGNLKNGINDIKNHPWFTETDWRAFWDQEVIPPFIPPVLNDCDSSNFQTQKLDLLKVSSANEFDDAFSDF